MKALKKIAVSAFVTGALFACGGGGGNNTVRLANGTISFGVTDAPVTNAKSVIVAFNEVRIKHANDDEHQTFQLNDDGSPVIIDLLTLTGSQQQTLIDKEKVDAGEYEWIRFVVDEDESEIVFEAGDPESDADDQHESLSIPSDNLRLIGGFTVPSSGEVTYIIDFDLRHSIVQQGNGAYKLKPVLRMVDTSEVGHIQGAISDAMYDDCADVSSHENNVAINLFADEYNEDSFDDSDGQDAEPITAAIVSSEDGNHTFEIGFVTAGDYKVVLTCGADEPEVDDSDNAELEFQSWADVTVEANETTELVSEGFNDI